MRVRGSDLKGNIFIFTVLVRFRQLAKICWHSFAGGVCGEVPEYVVSVSERLTSAIAGFGGYSYSNDCV